MVQKNHSVRGTFGAPCSLSHLAACLISSTAWGKSRLPINCNQPCLCQSMLPAHKLKPLQLSPWFDPVNLRI